MTLDYGTAVEFISKGRNKESRRYANNTYLERRAENAIALRLHSTDVVTFYADDTVMLNSGGWLTVTTKDRLNYVLGIRVYSDRGRWFVSFLRDSRFDEDNVYPYFDGMTLDVSERRVINPEDGPNVADEDRDNRAMRRAISRYVALYTDETISALCDNAPNRGDCFYCQMVDVKTGLPIEDSEHLKAHIAEGYVMVSTIFNAVKAKGYPNPVVILRFAPDSARRALTTYLRKRLLQGVAVSQ